MTKGSLIKTGGLVLGLGILAVLMVYVATAKSIGDVVRERCKTAQIIYNGVQYTDDCVPSLLKMVEDDQRTYAERNSAVWALGQLGDKRALPILQKYYTGVQYDREPWNGIINQYELKKAIKLLEGGINITSPLWRD